MGRNFMYCGHHEDDFRDLAFAARTMPDDSNGRRPVPLALGGELRTCIGFAYSTVREENHQVFIHAAWKADLWWFTLRHFDGGWDALPTPLSTKALKYVLNHWCDIKNLVWTPSGAPDARREGYPNMPTTGRGKTGTASNSRCNGVKYTRGPGPCLSLFKRRDVEAAAYELHYQAYPHTYAPAHNLDILGVVPIPKMGDLIDALSFVSRDLPPFATGFDLTEPLREQFAAMFTAFTDKHVKEVLPPRARAQRERLEKMMKAERRPDYLAQLEALSGKPMPLEARFKLLEADEREAGLDEGSPSVFAPTMTPEEVHADDAEQMAKADDAFLADNDMTVTNPADIDDDGFDPDEPTPEEEEGL